MQRAPLRMRNHIHGSKINRPERHVLNALVHGNEFAIPIADVCVYD